MMPLRPKHSQEFKEIVERIPDNYSSTIVIGLACFIFILAILSIVIRVPDKVIAEVKITSTRPPIILKAQVPGKIIILKDDLPCYCEQGDYVAIIDNPASPDHVSAVKKAIRGLDILHKTVPSVWHEDSILFLGELEPLYYNLKQQLQYYHVLLRDNKYSYEIKLLQQQICHDSINLIHQHRIFTNNKEQYDVRYRQYKIDSILLASKTLLEHEYDQSFLSLLNAERQVVFNQSDIFNLTQSIINSRLKIESLFSEYNAILEESKLKLMESYHNLIAKIQDWENRYVFMAPQSGIVELANILTSGTFVSAGEPVFNIVYEENTYFGIAVLPANGAGDVKKGQSVNIKVDLYPFQEYGMLQGKVYGISLNSLDKSYLVYIDLPDGLLSSNKYELTFAETMYGQAEIITKDKKLISKIFHHIYKLMNPSNKERSPEKGKEDETKKLQYQF